MGAQLNNLSPTPQWPRTPRGLWSGSNFLGASLCLLWDLPGPSEAGAGPLALPPWTARTCQRCWAPGVGRGKGGSIHMEEICIPHLRLASLVLAPFACERRRAIRPAVRPPPRWSAPLGAVPVAGGLLTPSALTSAHPGPYPGRPCCMVMGCQGDIHLFSGPGPQLRGALARMAAGGSEGREGERARKHPAGAPPSRPGQRLPAPPLGAASARYRRGGTEGGPEVKGQVEPLLGLEHDGGELGNAWEGACASYFIHSLRKTFVSACWGALSQMQGRGRNPGESRLRPCHLEIPQERCKGNAGVGVGLKKTEITGLET